MRIVIIYLKEKVEYEGKFKIFIIWNLNNVNDVVVLFLIRWKWSIKNIKNNLVI